MEILAVEPDERMAELLAVALEHARPGSEVGFFPSLESAVSAAEQLGGDGEEPRVVILGAGALARCDGHAVQAMRDALRPRVALLAFAADPADAERAKAAGVDGVYPQQCDWPDCCAAVRRVLGEWIAG